MKYTILTLFCLVALAAAAPLCDIYGGNCNVALKAAGGLPNIGNRGISKLAQPDSKGNILFYKLKFIDRISHRNFQ